MQYEDVIAHLKALADPQKIVIKRDKFGIEADHSLGIYQKDLKLIAKEIGTDNKLAIKLFDSGIYEARILCSKIYDPNVMTQKQMEQWVASFENWEICDSFCMGLFSKSRYAIPKAIKWSKNNNEFIKRAGFVLMACYGFADKYAGNECFEQFFPYIEAEAKDDRIYVKKAVNWALRNIGKRNRDLHYVAISVANKILKLDYKSAKWIAKNALSELNSSTVNILDYPREIYRN
jgi:3-methyladenine DNA glycosylase AlkD